MRAVLRLLGTRYGIALGLLLLVLIVVAAFRGTAGSRSRVDYAPPIEPSRSADAHPALPDDGPDAAGSSPSLAPQSVTEATTTATRFTAAWLKHTGVTGEQWRAGLAPYATTEVMASLQRTDPARVPANSTTGDVRLTVRNASLAEAAIPLDAGVLKLRLVVVDGRWKVAGIDLERSQ